MTDTIHKHSFKIHFKMIYYLFNIIKDITKINGPLWKENTENLIGSIKSLNNVGYIQIFVADLFSSSFPIMSKQQIENIITGLFYVKDYFEFNKLMQNFLAHTNFEDM